MAARILILASAIFHPSPSNSYPGPVSWSIRQTTFELVSLQETRTARSSHNTMTSTLNFGPADQHLHTASFGATDAATILLVLFLPQTFSI